MLEELPVVCKGCKFSGMRKVKDKKTREVNFVKSCNYMESVAEMQAIADYENALANMVVVRKVAPYNVRCGFRKERFE